MEEDVLWREKVEVNCVPRCRVGSLRTADVEANCVPRV